MLNIQLECFEKELDMAIAKKFKKIIFIHGVGNGRLKQEIISICKICEEIGVDFIKTSTGVIGRGATTADIILLRKLVPAKMKIKASGGIKDKNAALDLIEAGADRIGTSSSVNFFQNES